VWRGHQARSEVERQREEIAIEAAVVEEMYSNLKINEAYFDALRDRLRISSAETIQGYVRRKILKRVVAGAKKQHLKEQREQHRHKVRSPVHR